MTKQFFPLVLALLIVSITQCQEVQSKRCKTCGKPLRECQYKGKHQQKSEIPKRESRIGRKPNNNSYRRDKTVRLEGNTLRFTVDGQEYSYKMVYVNGGSFTMGCTSEQGGKCHSDECPAHSVTVSSYYIGQTEVTQALWKAVMGNESAMNRWATNLGYGPNYPAYNVSYLDAESFICRLNELTGCSFRLPTEEEWEYAARGGDISHGFKYSGSDDLDDVAWYGNGTIPVAQKLANELGIYDMSGNVQEWCNSLWCNDYNNRRTGPERVYRGGGWINGNTFFCRVSMRFKAEQSYFDSELGFRLVL